MNKKAKQLLLGDQSELRKLLDIPMEVIDSAQCSANTSELFFSEFPDAQEKALSICAGCPVREMCLAYALENEDEGIWGGVSADDRKILRDGDSVIPLEERQLIIAMRDDLDRKVGASLFEEKYGVTKRTYYRWQSELEKVA